jgi:hypothetical protein
MSVNSRSRLSDRIICGEEAVVRWRPGVSIDVPCKPKVHEPHMAEGIQDDVLGLQVTVDDVAGVQKVKRNEDLGTIKSNPVPGHRLCTHEKSE